MAPAFGSRQQAMFYLVTILFFLILPLILGWTSLPPRRAMYEAAPITGTQGAYDYVGKAIFDQKGDLDLAFVGDSLIWAGLDPLYVKTALAPVLGRPANVVTLGHPHPGLDMDYLYIKDLLAHRRTKMIVMHMPTDSGTYDFDGIHSQLYHLFQPVGNWEFFEDLPLVDKISLYAAAVLGAPRHLLSLFRSNATLPSRLEQDLGAIKQRLGSDSQSASYKEFSPDPPALPAASIIYSQESKESFEFAGSRLGPYYSHFAKLIAETCRDHDTRLIIINIPLNTDREKDKVVERQYWPDILGFPVDMVGIPPQRLFASLSIEEFRLLYFTDHLNKNGNEYLTKALAPALAALASKYEADDRLEKQ